MHGWPRPLPFASGFLLSERTPPAIVAADAPRSPIAHRLTYMSGFISKKPMPELGILKMGVTNDVRAIGLHEFTR